MEIELGRIILELEIVEAIHGADLSCRGRSEPQLLDVLGREELGEDRQVGRAQATATGAQQTARQGVQSQARYLHRTRAREAAVHELAAQHRAARSLRRRSLRRRRCCLPDCAVPVATDSQASSD